MKAITYYGRFIRERGTATYNVTFPDVPEAITCGADADEAMSMAREALELALSGYISDGSPLPRARAAKGRLMRDVEVSASAGIKIALYEAWLKSGITKSDLARRMGIHKANVDRLFDITRETRLEQLESAFRALSLKLRLNVIAA